MSNLIRNCLTIYGPIDATDSFVGRFVRGGLEEFVPIPSTARAAHKYSETWGACPDGCDIEILTRDSIAAVEFRDDSKNESRPQIKSIDAHWLNYNKFTLADHHNYIVALSLPSFLGQDKIPVALIVFHTKWSIPNHWIEAVINTEYERGIVLHMQSYDVMANYEPPEALADFPDTPLSSCEHFHSYTSAGTEYIQSGHCAILIKEVSAHLPTFDVVNNGDYDATLPPIDDEGNALSFVRGPTPSTIDDASQESIKRTNEYEQ